MTDKELKPCSYCPQQNVGIIVLLGKVHFHCARCGARTTFDEGGGSHIDEQIEKWNTRTLDTKIESIRALRDEKYKETVLLRRQLKNYKADTKGKGLKASKLSFLIAEIVAHNKDLAILEEVE